MAKHCPKCRVEMGHSNLVHILPAINSLSGFHDPVSTTAGLPVVVFVCPDCNYVELYRQQM